MIFVIDGGSILNQVPELFDEGKNIIQVVEPFFERYGEALEYRGHSAFFILRGIDSGSKLPRRLRYGAFTLIFSNKAGEEEALIFEQVTLSIPKDETVVVTDNLLRGERAGFQDVGPMRCADFKSFIKNAERKMLESEREDEGEEESVEFWSGVFGVSTDFSVDLSKTKPRKRQSLEGLKDEQ